MTTEGCSVKRCIHATKIIPVMEQINDKNTRWKLFWTSQTFTASYVWIIQTYYCGEGSSKQAFCQ